MGVAPRLWRLLDAVDYWVMQARLWRVDALYGPEPETEANRKRGCQSGALGGARVSTSPRGSPPSLERQPLPAFHPRNRNTATALPLLGFRAAAPLSGSIISSALGLSSAVGQGRYLFAPVVGRGALGLEIECRWFLRRKAGRQNSNTRRKVAMSGDYEKFTRNFKCRLILHCNPTHSSRDI